MNFVSSAIKLNNIKTYNSTSNTANDVFKKKFYSDYEEVDYNNYKDIDYNNRIDLQKQIENQKDDKEWYEYIGDAVGFAKDVGVTWYASLACGALELVENVADGLIMARGFVTSKVVSIWDKEAAKEIEEATSRIVAYDWTEKLYSETVTALGVDEEIAYGKLHTAGSFIGTTAAYVAVSCIPGGQIVAAGVGAASAMGSASEMALNCGASFDEAFCVGTVAGVTGAITGGTLNKIQGAAAGSKTLMQVAGHTLRGAGVAMIEPAVNTTTQYLVYGQDMVDKEGNKIYNGVDGYLDYYKDSGGLLQTSIAGVVGASSTAFKGYKGYKSNKIKIDDISSVETVTDISDDYLKNTKNNKFLIDGVELDKDQVKFLKQMGINNLEFIDDMKKNPVEFYLNFKSEFRNNGITWDDFLDIFDIDIGKNSVSSILEAAELYDDKNIFLVQKAKQLYNSLDKQTRSLIDSIAAKPGMDIDSNKLQQALEPFLSVDEINKLNSINSSNLSNLSTAEKNAIYQFTSAGGLEIAQYNRGKHPWSLEQIENAMNSKQKTRNTGIFRSVSSSRTINDEIDNVINKNLNKKTVTGVRYVKDIGPDITLSDYFNGKRDIQDLVGMSFSDKANTSVTVLDDLSTSYSNNINNKVKIEAVIPPDSGAFIEGSSGLKSYSCMEFLTKRNSNSTIVGAHWDNSGRLVLETLMSFN